MFWLIALSKPAIPSNPALRPARPHSPGNDFPIDP